MLQQRLAEELSENVNRVNAGIDEVAEHKIDDPVLPSEGNRGLSAFASQRIEPSPFASGQHNAQNLQVGTCLWNGFLWAKLVVSQVVLLNNGCGKLSSTTLRWHVGTIRAAILCYDGHMQERASEIAPAVLEAFVGVVSFDLQCLFASEKRLLP